MYKLTDQAAEDFAGIYDYTFLQFGETQADHYTEALEAFFDTLAEMPHIGREYPSVPGVMLVEFHRHTVFYTIRDTDILIASILHQQMNHPRYFQRSLSAI
ncbi:type II toxin-antitoxin system RelE/ParE family toxin [Photorhabdus laumondii subsp. laumondii]|uniref:Toxin n=2 Tax=Photorhabdus laumondii subsp. laumondii TaxID=141679 RepID=Q7MYA1_PHOLL|nr:MULTISPECIES: type II toxin-antitoxin system RelE/ParE family toxin [Photorhabdus]AWK44287.1 plasmid stabilization protein [Photorhabdus laumondii subsp. laumondii]AXG49600.1 type II toxin-antitoxin system RelE/ParE family toxin [Photorhabdus laumondii subsp. laumondii]MCC8382905.1 type II toxin-antitoxin system RelE/ParE family toxin [Photorhabdus laumondii]MCC8386974.1 type II toxin-antitoxin system RelE/ParE family toxin [Photorhabdus laumondii]MCC8412242.1 type II toxin-antitoxin system